jgi:Caspase domain
MPRTTMGLTARCLVAKYLTIKCLAILALSLAVTSPPAQAEKRVALLIGNNAYEGVPKLQTAANDARAVAAGLRDLGFSVSVAENQSRRAMSEALLAFDKAVEPGDIAFFFFAGHGFEIRGQNYLLPTDVPDIADGQEELMRDSSFPAERVVERLQARGARTVILVLDACRNNPFERPGGRGLKGTGGLAAMTPAEGVFIVYSAGAKQTALDQLAAGENARNSVFTRQLVKRLAEPDLTLVQIAKRLQTDVRQLAASVGHDQTPAYYDQVVGDVVLNQSERHVIVQPLDPLRLQPPQPGPPSPAMSSAAAHPPASPDARPAAAAAPMMAELDALAATKSWRELGAHLTAVQPTARDSHWASLAEQAAMGDLAASPADFDVRLAAVEHYLTTFPTLRSSEKFLALRASIGLGAFGDCFDGARGSDVGRCSKELASFVRSTPDRGGLAARGSDLARDAARLVARKLNRATAAPFFAIALEAPADRAAALCTDTELAGVVLAALGAPADSPEAKAGVWLTGKCWDALNGAIVAQVAREAASGSYLLRNACPTLLARNALTGLRASRCREVVSR